MYTLYVVYKLLILLILKKILNVYYIFSGNLGYILILILLVGIIGITIAYFSNTTSIDYLFGTKEYGTTIKEKFVSPDNWLPSDTTEKTVTVTNSGNEAVRICYAEIW